MGITWCPKSPSDVMLEEYGEPTIGLNNDLRDSQAVELGSHYLIQMSAIARVCDHWGPLEQLEPSTVSLPSTRLNDTRFSELVSEDVAIISRSCAMARVDLAEYRPLITAEVAAYLRKIEGIIITGAKAHWLSNWLPTVIMQVDGPCDEVKTTFGAACLQNAESDQLSEIWLMQTVESATRVAFNMYDIRIPSSLCGEVREMFGITALDDADPCFLDIPILYPASIGKRESLLCDF
ncbi:hypothetical protein AURDEDRAFT_130987 [Auricularia subglabra TFB-10046 SS5]|uniref:Uncharacterized protein n=1 Tax=Auricularia subglabra (strain TFB-10046 / SS5) TaxID=717982 RepID=J0WRV2_AURST|nr:hypothetical protein AURDEDRAFT_130987 [Auricularia subglabra TFB-10046 SS5]